MNIAKNIRLIREERGFSQKVIADALNVDVAVVSNIENEKRELRVSELEIISNSLEVDLLYLLTYPDQYIKKGDLKQEPVEAILQIKLQADKKEQVLRLVFGENNLEILNK
ncbi:transcriptional regulator with XRE-family HTH domain [Dysgonomonas sp. PH5-45]|uniref:helix-turn-helix domain-containing protein n=1 Tax=unclassified Dysgonomonas TaxID=2630389 RepID=UPI0024757349|nr:MULTISPECIES: helix-turn-helix transcriptional regulator [unclassified Dysgonomonas]MDH6355438.1 transcriptional regulator with XRE-family HTH domain [Dysgonomonas sp. PH5-45]MDH6388335.1 transcriptional regulator with XRE-family HTH domain [Dysgonomonas sp. PH5-37]